MRKVIVVTIRTIGQQDRIRLNIVKSVNRMLIKHGLKKVNLLCIMKRWRQCRQRQCSNLRLHSPDLMLGLLSYRDNIYEVKFNKRHSLSCSAVTAVTVSIFGFAVGFLIKTTADGQFWFLRFQILIRCKANTNDTGENTCTAVVQNSIAWKTVNTTES